jgi:hypothetical protein
MTERRTKVLNSLLALDRPLEEIRHKLPSFGWDSEKPLVILTRSDAASILRRFTNDDLSASDVEEWASLIESREDIGFEESHERILRDLIYELANPFLTRELSKSSATEWASALSSDY